MDSYKFQISEFGKPSQSGVYIVCAKVNCGSEHILYIGSSKNINKRLSSLRHPYRIAYDRLENCLVYTKHYLCYNYLEIESILIKKFNPLMNRKG